MIRYGDDFILRGGAGRPLAVGRDGVDPPFLIEPGILRCKKLRQDLKAVRLWRRIASASATRSLLVIAAPSPVSSSVREFYAGQKAFFSADAGNNHVSGLASLSQIYAWNSLTVAHCHRYPVSFCTDLRLLSVT